MPHIHKDHQPVTQITVVESEPGRQEDALSLMVERARFMARQPGFVSISLHRSLDGSRIVNYIQWQNRELLQSAHHSPEFRAEWGHFDELTRDIEPQLYDVALVVDGEEKKRAGSNGGSRTRVRTAGARKTTRPKPAERSAAARKSARRRMP